MTWSGILSRGRLRALDVSPQLWECPFNGLHASRTASVTVAPYLRLDVLAGTVAFDVVPVFLIR